MNDYHAFKSTSGGSGGGGGFGCGWIVIVVVAFYFVSFIFTGASWAAIETLLALGLIAFLLAKSFF